ncbi:hypothetical protein OZX57_06515 [Bifidobacterium sp. ESL0682]|uniref:phage tail tube protein n=1 Tax=Bifidobacterium sp. ESL0682 TaxID=2983212 RepID=UPI0023F63A98|nr:hypothetical protein [Bifidobacterium sp. ESL0682]WEV41639.1 hypothetical protein OZX57_06515 [Bifidobacterium sp. ESL0682]
MTIALARRFKVEISKDGTTWNPLNGLTDFNPKFDPTLQDANDYENEGWGSKEITMNTWSLECKANRIITANRFDEGQELCRKCVGKFGEDARLYVRWYDRNGMPEAHQGRAIVGYTQSKTGVADLEEVSITFTGDGVCEEIDNPAASSPAPSSPSTPSTESAVSGDGTTPENPASYTVPSIDESTEDTASATPAE